MSNLLNPLYLSAVLFFFLLEFAIAAVPSVSLNGYTITGRNSSPNVDEFLGIPFSAPPVGNLRWRPPQFYQGAAKGSTVKADTAKLCRQKKDDKMIGKEEDCNNLNIWKPDSSVTVPTEGFPIMVWIHGGSFTSASPNLSFYNGTKLVEDSIVLNKPIIMISIQYRLGGLGFMASDDLQNEYGSYNSTGNYGILDQIFGLKWIQKNIKLFNGNKNKVTIFGESAGAYSICTLIASPLTNGVNKGLFSGAIAESAYCANSYQGPNLAKK